MLGRFELEGLLLPLETEARFVRSVDDPILAGGVWINCKMVAGVFGMFDLSGTGEVGAACVSSIKGARTKMQLETEWWRIVGNVWTRGLQPKKLCPYSDFLLALCSQYTTLCQVFQASTARPDLNASGEIGIVDVDPIL